MARQTSSQNTDGQFTGKHMLAAMVAFFGVIIAVNATMAWQAGRTWTGLVVKNSYVASQQFNKELANAREIAKRGWKSSVEYRNGRIVLKLATRDGSALDLTNLHVNIGRPAFEQEDQTLKFVRIDAGHYEIKRKLAPGNWALRIEGGTGKRSYRRDARIAVSASQSDDHG